MARWRFIDSGPRPGAFNMVFDEALARTLAEAPRSSDGGHAIPSLRLFRWNPWAISLGYNQSMDDIDRERCVREAIDVVRRPTGGRAILHAEELTYSVVMEANRKSVLAVYNDISRALVRGLSLMGVDASLQKSQPDFSEAYRHASSIPCFTSSARYEIEWRGKKLVGSAQRRFAGAGRDVVLQHGSILCGPAHRKLADLLRLPDESTRDLIRADLREKTTDLAEITGASVDIERLADCVRQGFAREWGVEFTGEGATDANEGPAHVSTEHRRPGAV